MTRIVTCGSQMTIVSDADPTLFEENVSVGTFWINTSLLVRYFCLDATSGSQKWVPINGIRTDWAPLIQGSTTPGTCTYVQQKGVYTKSGIKVFVKLEVEWTGHTGSGDLIVAGFHSPFLGTDNIVSLGIVMVENMTIPPQYSGIVFQGIPSTSTAGIAQMKSNQPKTMFPLSTTGHIVASINYITVDQT